MSPTIAVEAGMSAVDKLQDREDLRRPALGGDLLRAVFEDPAA